MRHQQADFIDKIKFVYLHPLYCFTGDLRVCTSKCTGAIPAALYCLLQYTHGNAVTISISQSTYKISLHSWSIAAFIMFHILKIAIIAINIEEGLQKMDAITTPTGTAVQRKQQRPLTGAGIH